jgi:hypothetical protein
MAAINPTEIQLILEDSGLSSTDRVTAKAALRVAGLKPGQAYEYSSDAGRSWTSLLAPLQSTSAIRFDGQNDYISIPDNTSLPSGNNAYTLEAWIKPDAMGDRGIVGWGPWGTPSAVNALRLMGNGSIRHYWWGNDLDVQVGNLADGSWHHVAATFDGTTRKVYVDGVLKGSDTPSTHRVPIRAQNIRIGSTNNGEFFKGSIDDVGIWSRALTQEEITQRQSVPVNQANKDLALFYGFDETTGATTSAAGASGYGLAGTLVNGPTWTTREIAASQSQGTTSIQIQLRDGNYADGEVLVREQASQGVIVTAAPLTVDTLAPAVRLNQPGGIDAIVSTKTGDAVISGTAEPGSSVKLLSRVGSATSGNLRITSDNAADIYLNGKYIASTTDWTKPYDFTGLNIQAGPNVLAILAYDVGGIAGLSGRFTVPSGTFGTSNLGGWKVLNVDPEPLSDNSAASRDKSNWKLPANWTTTNFDDSAWSLPVDVRAKTGQYPWGNVTGDPSWIWSADPYNHDAVLFRYTFTGTNSDQGLQTIADNIQVASDGSFSYALSPDQINLLGQGQGKSLVAMQQDLAGNQGRSAELSFAVDTEIGAVKITSIGGGDGKVSSELTEVGQGPLKFQVDQYTGYWSNKLADLQAYAKNYNPLTSKNRYSVVTDAIDFTDDAGGFAGELSYDRRWPAAEAINYWGTGGINNQFFARVTADFYVSDASKYRFRTYNDDGVFLLVDNKLIINDPTLHPERIFTGDIDLQPGNHSIELYFFENGGEASLEFSASRFDPVKNAWGPYKLVGQDPGIKAKSEQRPDNVVLGEADPNAIVNLSIAGAVLGSAIAGSDGKFTYELTDNNLALIANTQGSTPLLATITDNAGNAATSAPATVAVSDPTPQVVISAIGGSDGQVTTKSGDFFVEGTGVANLATSLFAGGQKLGQIVADAQGRFSFELTTEALQQLGQGGNKQVFVEQATASGKKGQSPVRTFSIDTQAPTVTVESIGLGGGKVSRSRNLIAGQGEANGTVSLLLGQSLLGTSATDAQGRFVYTLTNQALEQIAQAPLAQLKAVQLDTAGNRGESLPSSISTKLAAPVLSRLALGGQDAVVSSQQGDGLLTGVGEAGLPVALLFNGQRLETTATADETGQFSATLSAADLTTIGEGSSRTLTVQQLDDYGNLGEATTATFAVDTLAPVITLPAVGDPVALGGTDGVVSTQAGDATLAGKAEQGQLTVLFGMNQLAVLQVAADGAFRYSLTSTDLDLIGQGGSKLLRLEQRDGAGNLGVAQISFAIDTLPPPPPVINAVGGDSVVSGRPTDNLIQGRTDAGATVNLFVNGQLITTVKALSDGLFEYRLSNKDLSTIGEGTASLVAEIADTAGNRSRSTAFPFRVDTLAPAQPLLQSVGGDDQVVSTRGSGQVTQTVDNQVLGRAEANATVQLYLGSRLLGQTQALDDGRFTYSLTAANVAAVGQGTGKTIQATAVDAAGNASVASQGITFAVDTVAPTAPKLSVVGGSDGIISSLAGDNLISGTAEALSRVELRAVSAADPTSPLLSVLLTADSSGKWSHAFTQSQLSALETTPSPRLLAIASDAAGNQGASLGLDLKVDVTAPALSLANIGGADGTISSVAGDAVIRGTAEANRWVSLSVQGRKFTDVRAGQNGTFSYTLSADNLRLIGEGLNKQLQISQVDAAGNSSSLTSIPFTVDVTAPTKAVIRSLGGTDKIVTSAEADRVVRGTGEVGSTIDLMAVAGTTRTLLGRQTVGADGNFAYTLTPENLSLLGKGVGKSLVAATADAAGNRSSSDAFGFQVQGLWTSGTTAADKLAFASGIDALTGREGADTLMIRSLGTVVMDTGLVPAFDRIVDLEIGVDRIDAPTAVPVGQVRDLGQLQGLVSSAIGNLLTTSAFPANSAAIFRFNDFDFGSRTFLAINDGIAGFRPQTDGIIEITGYTGNLTALSLV